MTGTRENNKEVKRSRRPKKCRYELLFGFAPMGVCTAGVDSASEVWPAARALVSREVKRHLPDVYGLPEFQVALVHDHADERCARMMLDVLSANTEVCMLSVRERLFSSERAGAEC